MRTWCIDSAYGRCAPCLSRSPSGPGWDENGVVPPLLLVADPTERVCKCGSEIGPRLLSLSCANPDFPSTLSTLETVRKGDEFCIAVWPSPSQIYRNEACCVLSARVLLKIWGKLECTARAGPALHCWGGTAQRSRLFSLAPTGFFGFTVPPKRDTVTH